MALLAASPELRQKMGRAGRQRAQEQFQLNNQITKFENFYRKIINSDEN